MEIGQIVAELDAEIERLHQIRALLSGGSARASAGRSTAPRKKRVLSPEARAKISAAQKRRWAKQKREAK
jgi:hypothetical protein